MKIYHYPFTQNPIKVQLLCHLLGVAPDYELVRLDQLEQQTPKLLALNPNGKLPVLVDGDLVLWESNAILHYLATRHASSLWPQNAVQQSDVLRWLNWEAGTWSYAAGAFAHHRIHLPAWGYEGYEPAIDKRAARFARAAGVLNITLKRTPWLTGNTLSIADIAVSAGLMFAAEAAIPLAPYPHLEAWLKRLRGFAWWQATRADLVDFINTNMHITINPQAEGTSL